MSKDQDTDFVSVAVGQSTAELERFDIIKACEGYLASFEAQTPKEASPSYLHGWRMGRLGQSSFEPTKRLRPA